MNMTKFLQAADPIYKNPIFSFPLTATDILILAANVAKLYAIPANVELLLINSTSNIYVLFGDDTVEASVPDEYDVLDGSAPMLNPGLICGLSFAGLTHFSVVCAGSCVVSVQRWARR